MPKLILVIDDDDGLREVLELMLQLAGYRTAGHADHTTGYERIREVRPDFVICDLMNGYVPAGWNTLLLASFDPDTRDIPVMLISANTHYLRCNREYLNERGCDTLEKPFTVDALLAHVAAAIGPAA